jgi:hypothetical protein
LLIGHCGWCGIGGVILFISIGNLLSAVTSMALVFAAYTSAQAFTPLASSYIFDGLGPLFWACAGLTSLFGFLSLLTSNSKARAGLLNIWTALMFLYIIATIAYGVHVVLQLRNLYLIAPDIVDVLMKGGFLLVEELGASPNERLRRKFARGGSIFGIVESMSVAGLLKVMPFPFNFLLFMGFRPDISACLYVVIPGALALFSFPIVLSIRNYFASPERRVVNHRQRYEGVSLFQFLCGSEAEKNEDVPSDEEDLASTFAGSNSSEGEDQSLLGSSGASDAELSSRER